MSESFKTFDLDKLFGNPLMFIVGENVATEKL